MSEPQELRDPSTPPASEPEALAAEPPVTPEVEAFAAGTAAAEALPSPAADDFRDRWLRSEAELQNFRRRAHRDRDESVRAAEDRLLLDMVSVLDDLERALAAVAGDPAAAAWTQGVSLTAQRLRDALTRAGVEPIAAVGAPFDPSVHEALLEIDPPDGIAPGQVAQEVLRGYRRGDRALRAARVVVARGEAGA